MIGFLVITGLVLMVVGIWLAVISVRFLISGRKAFDRYLFMTSDPIRPALPVVPPGSGDPLARGTDYTRKNYGA